jgi:orotate phosphoribosyltransferase
MPMRRRAARLRRGGRRRSAAVRRERGRPHELPSKPPDAVYVRKDMKDHGRDAPRRQHPTGRRARMVLLEDVVTTGGSTLSAAAKLRSAGYAVSGVVALVDRLEGGREAIEGDGLPLVAVFTRTDFIPD